MYFDKVPHDRESEPQPPMLSSKRAVRLAKPVENVWEESLAMPAPLSLLFACVDPIVSGVPRHDPDSLTLLRWTAGSNIC